MYAIIEMQTDINGNTAVLPFTVRSDINEAKSVYHTILASAAVSNVAYHTATILYHNGNQIESECFEHLPEPEVEES